MIISVTGIGNIGGRLATVWAERGHSIRLGVQNVQAQEVQALVAKHPQRISAHTVREAAVGAEAILFAVPAAAAYTVGQEIGPTGDTILIDAMNAVFRKPEPYDRTSEALHAATGSTRIVKCFNWIGAENMDNPHYGDEVADMLLCGEEAEAKAIVYKLAQDCDFRVFDIGGIAKEPLLESSALLWNSLANEAGLGRNIAFKVLAR